MAFYLRCFFHRKRCSGLCFSHLGMGIYFPFIFFSIVLVIKWSDVRGARWVGDGIIAVRLIALVCQDISPAYALGQFLQFGSVWYLYSSTGSVFLISESHRLARTTRPSNIPSPTCLIHFMSYFVFNSTPFIETILPLITQARSSSKPLLPDWLSSSCAL